MNWSDYRWRLAIGVLLIAFGVWRLAELPDLPAWRIAISVVMVLAGVGEIATGLRRRRKGAAVPDDA